MTAGMTSPSPPSQEGGFLSTMQKKLRKYLWYRDLVQFVSLPKGNDNKQTANKQQQRSHLYFFWMIGLALVLSLINFSTFHYLHTDSSVHPAGFGLQEKHRHGSQKKHHHHHKAHGPAGGIHEKLRQWKLNSVAIPRFGVGGGHTGTGVHASTANDLYNTASTTDLRATIAYAVTLTGCTNTVHLDGLAVLKHSIYLNSFHNPASKSRYSYRMYAVVHPDAKACFPHKVLQDTLGYEVLYRDLPIQVSDITGPFLRDNIENSGCCGAKELLKLHAYTLTDHPIVVHLDVDSLVRRPLDELFDVILDGPPRNANVMHTNVTTMFHKPLPKRVDAFFTRDYSMVNPPVRHVGVQGGFLVARTGMDVFKRYKGIIRKGHFTEAHGWGDKGDVRFWGDMQFQGLVAYYYDFVRRNTGVELNGCMYNNMADRPRTDDGKCFTGRDKCQDCRLDVDLAEIRTFHYTTCQKPWLCVDHPDRDGLCSKAHHEWFKVRLDLERSWRANRAGALRPKHFLGFCRQFGEEGYNPMYEMPAESGGAAMEQDANLVAVRNHVPTTPKEETNQGYHQDHNSPPTKQSNDEKSNDETKHQVAGLSCSKYNGPSDEAAQEMVYWSDIPTDSKFVSPFHRVFFTKDDHQYLTFEPDHGGWNNIRMSMETTLALALAMGRTLVLPPEQGMYLLDKEHHGKQKTDFSFTDFFHLESVAKEHAGLNIITMEEYLQHEAMTGRLVNSKTGHPEFPPHNRTNWNGEKLQPLWDYLRRTTKVPLWKPTRCVAAFPASSNPREVTALNDMLKEIIKEDGGQKPQPGDEITHAEPLPMDAPAKDRLRETLAHRRKLCLYDGRMQSAKTIHFVMKEEENLRLLTHFYAFLYFEDWRQELWMKRFVRDHIRYVDEIMCAAGRVVEAVRERARSRDPEGNPEGIYNAYHVRRGDFQYGESRVSANVLYKNSKKHMVEGATVYVATDEKKKSYFDPLKEHYDLVYLSDFKHLLGDLNTNYYGMLDQLVASRSEIFYGTWWSTFTGYINRMRGYHAVKNKLEGHEDGTIKSWYSVPHYFEDAMQGYSPLNGGFWTREWPTAWRGLDNGIEELFETGGRKQAANTAAIA